MNRSLATPRFARPRTGVIAALVHRIRHGARLTGDARSLDAMSRDRLEDMGIAPRTQANTRTSGEAGPMPRASLW